MKHLFRQFFLLSIGLITFNASAQVTFENVTSELGPFHQGETWGAAWVDINNDYYPDIGNNNHRHRQSMWINQAGEGFRDGILQFDREWVLISEVDQDSHGSSYADLDNDGDQDLIQTRSSGGGRAQVFLNDQGFGIEQAVSMGIASNITGAGRLGVAYDYNRDGLLDVFYSSSSRTRNRVFKNLGNNTFVDSTQSNYNNFGACDGLNYIQFTDIVDDATGISNLEILCVDEGNFPSPVFDASAGTDTFTNVTDPDVFVSNTVDTATGDFDGDGDSDIIAVRGSIRYNGATLVNPNKIEAWITTQFATGEKSFTFDSIGDITIDDVHISRDPTEFDQIRIGSSNSTITSLPVTLDKNDPSAQGISTSTSKGVYIGYDVAASQWKLRIISTDFEDYYLEISGDGLTEPDDFVLHPVKDFGIKPTLFKNTGTGLERVYNIGIDEVTCASIATGDFDNDMDLDVYLACGWGVANISNRLYLNDGTGRFEEAFSHGAEGVIGGGIEQGYGVAESVVMADYDIDGRLDLFTTNGALFQPEFIGGPDELFRNTTDNTNNWIELDLIGVTVNRDAMGAKIIATAGGVDQIREQNGGYHRWSQNHKRIHFGLGPNSTVDIRVEWPDGTSDTYNNLTSNNLYEVTQSGTAQQIIPAGYNDYPDAAAGDECSDRGQSYTPELDKGIFLSKDCSTGLWSLRAVAGGSEESVSFTGYVLSAEAIVSVDEYEFEGGDVAEINGRRIDFSLSMSGAGVDGIEFDLGQAANACILIENEENITVGEYHLLAPSKLDLIQMGACELDLNGDLSVPQSKTLSSLFIPGQGGVSTNVIDLSDLNVSIGDSVTVSQLGAHGDLNGATELFSLSFNDGEYNFNNVTTGLRCTGTFDPTTSELNQDISVVDIGNGVPGIKIIGQTSSNVNLGGSCGDVVYQLTITSNIVDTLPIAACGMPNFSSDTDAGFYVWKDCGGDELWHVRSSAGGGGSINYVGDFLANSSITSISTFSFEPIDSFTSALSDTLLSFDMTLGGPWVDGLQFELNNNSQLCLTLIDPAQTIYVGAANAAFNSSVNLIDLSLACETPPTVITISTTVVSAQEASAEAIVTVDLSEISTESISVDYETNDGSAISGQDYTAVSGSLNFAAGESSKTISIPLIQDIDFEGDETFNILLSNSVNASILNNSSIVTIDDAGCISPANGDTWSYNYYEGVWDAVPDFANEVIVASGTANTVSTSPALSNDFYGFSYTTCLEVPFDGTYTFSTTSDDGSLLYVNNTLVVDNDGLHGTQTVTADYQLSAGTHQIKVDFFERTGQDFLSASWIAPDAPSEVCGEPNFSSLTDSGFYVWKDCGGDEMWYARASAGGGGAMNYVGEFLADAAMTSITPFSLEPTDSYVTALADTSLSFDMTMGGQWLDGIQFSLESSTEEFCLALNDETQKIFVGAEQNEFSSSVNLIDLSSACVNGPVITPEPLACGMPDFDSANDAGLFLWQACDTDETWHLTASAGGGFASFEGTITDSDTISVLLLTSFESTDSAILSNSDLTLSYKMTMGGPWIDSMQFDVSDDGDACFGVGLPVGLQVVVGEDNNLITPPFNMKTLDPC